ncbi:serine/threonine-protein kinase [Gordonia paraffinivorans]|uniref:serine/threonine-protein kinase n=1 Tax=Gordonia paraffinivorans TaxID=175628 RepID=UPI001445D1E3|nr:serine/threonine-protein kinase [Gordonia paraffinivorans]
MPRNPGEHFAGYTIIRLIGRGGMGEIYLARHPHLPRDEALKVLPANLSRDPMYRQRFVKEAEHASSVVHPSIVTVFNSGEYDGHLWIAMEYIDGIDALKLLRQNPHGLDAGTVIAIVRAIGAALDRAHATGLLHRDVKPANILLQGVGEPEPRVLLADFGIAKSQQDAGHLTSTNVFVGTVAYASPEQLLGETVDARADQYALAATVFELLTGRPPFQGESTASIIGQHLQKMPPRPSTLRPGISPAVDAVFERALAKEPGRRYGSCREFAEELERALNAPDLAKTRKAQDLQKGPDPSKTPTVRPGAPVPGEPAGAPRIRHAQAYPGVNPGYGPSQPPHPAVSGAPAPVAQNVGPANPYAGQPGGAGPGYPSGHSPQPGLTPPGGYPPPYGGAQVPPPKKKSSGLLIGLGALALVLVLAIAGVAIFVATSVSDESGRAAARSTPGTTTSDDPTTTTTTTTQDPADRTPDTSPRAVTGPGAVSVGECISVTMQPGSATTVLASRVDCGSAGLNFYTAAKIDNAASCASEQNSTLTFPGSSEKLCLTPNFYEGLCYQVPLTGGSLADYREVPCSSAPAARTVLARVNTRSTSAVSCSAGETRWTFYQPVSIGYCLVEV